MMGITGDIGWQGENGTDGDPVSTRLSPHPITPPYTHTRDTAELS